MDQLINGAAFTNEAVIPVTLPPGLGQLVSTTVLINGHETPVVYAASAPDHMIFEYDIANNIIRSISTGTLTPAEMIVANHNVIFTDTAAPSAIFGIEFFPTGPPAIARCTLPNRTNNGITAEPNGNIAVGDSANHIITLKWTLGSACQIQHIVTIPDAGTTIRSLASDQLSDIYGADSRDFFELTPSGAFKVLYRPSVGSVLYTPEEVRFEFNTILFTAHAPSGAAGMIGEISKSGSLFEKFGVSALAPTSYAATIDNFNEIWFGTGKNSLGVIKSGVTKLLTDPALPTSFQTQSALFAPDSQIYFGALNSRSMGIYNHVQFVTNPVSVTVSVGGTATFTVSAILQPFPGTVNTAFSVSSENSSIATVGGITQSNGQAKVSVVGLHSGTTKFHVSALHDVLNLPIVVK